MKNDLTAIEKFSLQHDMLQIPEQLGIYQDLIPKTTPGVGEQYAFEVNLDRCTGCKACVAGCHSENGLAEDETWRSVGIIYGTSPSPVVQHVTAACHHCLDPACLNGCPVDAYVKEDNGIVRHLDDQCFGCQYCTLKCPYDVPKYSKEKGIVHKCDMCISRLEVGQAPACVRACPNEAIKITLVNKEEIRANVQDFVTATDAPDSRYTLPTTRYLSSKKFPADMISSDFAEVKPEHSHWPLIIMLVLTQASVGAFAAHAMMSKFLPHELKQSLNLVHSSVGLVVGLLALGASIFHLGRPQFAFRAVIGLKHSWLSREILSFGIFAKMAVLYTAVVWCLINQRFLNWIPNGTANVLAALTIISGLVGLFCSVMVYRDTRRPFWDHWMTDLKFYVTAIVLGLSTIFAVSAVALSGRAEALVLFNAQFGAGVCLTIAGLMLIKLGGEAGIFMHLRENGWGYFKKSAWLMRYPLNRATALRFVCGAIGGILVPVFLAGTVDAFTMVAGSVLMLTLLLVAELAERYLFFRAVVPLRMPGGMG